MEVAGFGTYDVELGTGKVVGSPELLEIYGLTPHAPITEDQLAQLIHPEDLSRVRATTQLARNPEGADRNALDYRIVRPDGEIRWVQLRSHTFFAGEGPARSEEHTSGLQSLMRNSYAEFCLKK